MRHRSDTEGAVSVPAGGPGGGEVGAQKAGTAAAATLDRQMKVMLEDLQSEFDEFRSSSAELEQELERELERVEGRARRSELELRRVEETSKLASARVNRELMECQREVAQLREDRRETLRAVRIKEEALEQAAQSERRAQAEVENLREALDESMEVATFTQTELEDLKRTSDEITRHLYEDLEEAQSELALMTPIRSESAGGSLGSGRRNGGVGTGTAGTRRGRHFFTMASFEEEGEEESGGESEEDSGYDTPSVVGEEQDVSPTASGRVSTHGDDADDRSDVDDRDGVDIGDGESDCGGDGDGQEEVTTEGRAERFSQQQAAELQQELQRQLRLSAASTPPNRCITLPSSKGGRGSATTSTASCCSSYTTPGNHSNGKGNRLFDLHAHANGPPSSSSSVAVGHSRNGTFVIESETVLVASENEAVRRFSAGGKSKAPSSASGGGGGEGEGGVFLRGGVDGSVYRTWDDDDDRGGWGGDGRGRQQPWACGGGDGDGGLGDYMQALSSWRPFAWCHPQP